MLLFILRYERPFFKFYFIWLAPRGGKIKQNKPAFWQVLIMRLNVHVPVNFLSQVIFVFLLFLVTVIYANEVETKEKKLI